MEKTTYYFEEPEKAGKLYYLDDSGKIQSFVISGGPVLGRAGEGSTADLRLSSPFVSGKHGEFAQVNGCCYYRDLNSRNGTWLNGRFLGKTREQAAAPLEDGDILRIGRPEQADAPGNVVLLYVTRYSEDEHWEHFTPEADVLEFQVGRSQTLDPTGKICLTDKTISKNHCRFRRTMDGWLVENQSATNPVMVNNKTPDGPHGLRPKDIIRIANRYILYTEGQFYVLCGTAAPAEMAAPASPPQPASASPPPALPAAPSAGAAGQGELAIHIVRRRVKRNNAEFDLLRDVHLSVSRGEMVLILGGSGAGKTTFLNAVMGYEPAEGTVRFGETDIYQEYDKMKYEIGYVPQEDLLRKSDLVIDTLYNAAQMKMPVSLSDAERSARVQEVLNLFGLEHEQEQMVSKLSGGQRKRLSIAVEYIGDPTLFFLDEPDSGLDGIMARSLMQNLRFIADSGKIVLVISHSPDRATHLFDKIVVLAKSDTDNCGHLVFYGPPEAARRFFEVDSMEDIVQIINRPEEGGRGLADYYIQRFKDLRKEA